MKQTVIIILIVTLTLIWSISIPMLVFGEDSVSIEEVKKPLWAVEGVDAYEQLTYSGYQIVNSNVNLGQPGDYLVTYQAVDLHFVFAMILNTFWKILLYPKKIPPIMMNCMPVA